MVTMTTRFSSSTWTYTISIQRHGPSTKRKPDQAPPSSGPSRGNRLRGRTARLNCCLVLSGRLWVWINRSRSASEEGGHMARVRIGIVQRLGKQRSRQRALVDVRSLRQARELGGVDRIECDVETSGGLGHQREGYTDQH